MDPFCNPTVLLPLKLPPPFLPLLHKTQLHLFQSHRIRKLSLNLNCHRSSIQATAFDAAHQTAATSEINMVRTKQGLYTPKLEKKVVILWDLDNKPPRGPPFEAALALRHVAEKFGSIVDFAAYANRHAFVHLPQWVLQERRERRHMDRLERHGLTISSDPYICGVCGRKCRTNLDLKKHFRQLHERERQKKLNRMRSLKGKKRQRFKERFISNNHKYEEAAKELITPKVGYGLASELRRAGVYVKTVEDKPQAADWAVKKQMQHSMSRGIDWLFLVSDDSDFKEMLMRARESKLGTVVVGDWDRALGRHADLWVSWLGVENGEIDDKDLVPGNRRRTRVSERDNELFSFTCFDDIINRETDLDNVLDELAVRSELGGLSVSGLSAFSEGEEGEDDYDSDDDDYIWDSGEE